MKTLRTVGLWLVPWVFYALLAESGPPLPPGVDEGVRSGVVFRVEKIGPFVTAQDCEVARSEFAVAKVRTTTCRSEPRR